MSSSRITCSSRARDAQQEVGRDLHSELRHRLDVVGWPSTTCATSSTTTPTVACRRAPAIWVITMQVRSVSGTAGTPNRVHRSTTGMTRPRRLITPRTNAGSARDGGDAQEADDLLHLEDADGVRGLAEPEGQKPPRACAAEAVASAAMPFTPFFRARDARVCCTSMTSPPRCRPARIAAPEMP